MIYGDIFMLINAACDYVVLFLTALLLRRRILKRRLFLGAAIGGIYALLFLYISQKALLSFLLSLIFSLAMILAVFSFGNIRRFFRTAVCFYITAFLMGGAVSAVSRFTAEYMRAPMGSVVLLFCTMVFAAAAALFGGKLIEKRCVCRTVKVDFTVLAQSHSCTALVDSGNLLKDIETGLPVIILSPKVFGEDPPPCMKFLSVRTVTSETDLPCFRPESLKIEKKERKALLAIAPQNMNFADTEGLLPECLLF